MGLRQFIKNTWNLFNKDPTKETSDTRYENYYPSEDFRHKRYNYSYGDRSLLDSVINKMAMDAAAIPIKEVIVDEEDRFIRFPDESDINERFCVSANLDQTGSAFRLDAILTMLTEGYVAIVPVDADMDPEENDSYKLYTIRVGHIKEWYPSKVKMDVYDEDSGKIKEVLFEKKSCLIVQNPMYQVMNMQNSLMQRIIRKMNLLDIIDEEMKGNKLNMIVQLPYSLKTEGQMKQAERRRKAIEEQLVDNPYGIAYIDGTEHITQLNRPLDNNLMSQIEYMMKLFMAQVGVTTEILDGTADEGAMNNYMNRCIDWILTVFREEMYRKWLTQTARTRKHSIQYFKDPFKLTPVTNLADMGDKFIRNEILTKNEFRQKLGMRPSDDPSADMLRNPNISESKEQFAADMNLEENGNPQYVEEAAGKE